MGNCLFVLKHFESIKLLYWKMKANLITSMNASKQKMAFYFFNSWLSIAPEWKGVQKYWIECIIMNREMTTHLQNMNFRSAIQYAVNNIKSIGQNAAAGCIWDFGSLLWKNWSKRNRIEMESISFSSCRSTQFYFKRDLLPSIRISFAFICAYGISFLLIGVWSDSMWLPSKQ